MDDNNVFANFLADAQHLILDGCDFSDPRTSFQPERVVVYQTDYEIAALVGRLASCKVLYVAVQGRYLVEGSDAMSAPLNLTNCVNIITLLAPGIDDKAHVINVSAIFGDKKQQRRTLEELFKGDGKISLRNVFENPDLPKVFWDCSLGPSALREAFDTWDIQGLVDLQLVEWLGRVRFSRAGSKPLRPKSLVDCLDSSVGFRSDSAAQLLRTKLVAESLCLHGFMSLPNPEYQDDVLTYCLDQVQYLPAMYRKFLTILEAAGPRDDLDWMSVARDLATNRFRIAWARRMDGDFGKSAFDGGLVGQGRRDGHVPLWMNDEDANRLDRADEITGPVLHSNRWRSWSDDSWGPRDTRTVGNSWGSRDTSTVDGANTPLTMTDAHEG